MLTPLSNQQLPNSKYSRKKIKFICSCGNEISISWKNYKNNYIKSCGKCSNKYNIDNIKNQKFGYLKLKLYQNLDSINSNSKLWFICECGKEKLITLKSVVSGLTKSCGCGLSYKNGLPYKNADKYKKPIYYSKEYWLKQEYNVKLINENLPDKWCKNTTIRMKFLCKCGRIFIDKFNKISSGHKKSCGKCEFVKKEQFLNIYFGKLQLIDKDLPNEFHKNTYNKFWFRCECGNIKKIRFADVINGKQKKCGNCNLVNKSDYINKKFGHLTILNIPDNIKLYSEKTVKCKCTCGEICEKSFNEIVNGHVKTCGNCINKANKWWANKKSLIIKGKKFNKYSLEYLLNYFEGSYLQPLEGCNNTTEYIKIKCKLCNSVFKTKLSWIWRAKIKTCGCVKGNISFESHKIANYIESLGLKVLYGKQELKINDFKYDILIPDKKLIIEYNGLFYHSKYNKGNDLLKYKVAIENGYNYLMIYEDEWLNKNDIIKNLILNKLNLTKCTKLRPQTCNIQLINNDVANRFYERYHYIGKSINMYNIALYYNNDLICCMGLRYPSRQKSGDLEISRMVGNPEYKVQGCWSYILKWAISNLNIKGRLISFSDNRLYTGQTYKKIGFKYIYEIKPDYYWVKHKNRYHKSSLRKSENEKTLNKTESELREEQGYRKIYDLGKKKWELII